MINCEKGVPMELLVEGNAHIWFDPAFLKEDIAQSFSPSFWQEKNAVIGSAQGRGTTWFVRTSTCSAALRHYCRGGLIGKWIKETYFYTGWKRTRSYQEFVLLAYLREKGLPVPRPIGARVVRNTFLYQADLLVEKIDGASDLLDVLRSGPLNMRQYQHIGKLIRKLHDVGVCHSDLNIHNIMLDDKGAFWLIDFDKSGLRSGKSWKAGNLERLHRSFRKEKKRCDIFWREMDWHSILRGYVSLS